MNKSCLSILVIMMAFVSACSKNNDATPSETFEKIIAVESDDHSLLVELSSDQKLSVGYNPLYLRIIDQESKKAITDASIKIVPVMEMHMENGSMKHASPVENPSTSAAENGLFKAAAIFSMASHDHGNWTLAVEIRTSASAPVQTLILPINVLQAKHEKIKTIKLADGSQYMVTYIQPVSPKIGINEFELVIHERKSMFDFPMVDDFVIQMDPEMPSMGHGSPNNISPVLTPNGHYKGKVNFTMSGDWRIHLELTKEKETVKTAFDLTF